MSHTDDVLAEIVAANETVCQARSEMNLAKAVASTRSKAYAESVDNLTLTIPGSGRESTTPLLDEAEAAAKAAAEADQAEPGQEEPPEPDQVPPAGKTEPGQGEPDYFPPFKDGEPAIRSEAEADQEIYDEVKPRPRGRKTGRKPTKKARKTGRK